MRRAVPNWGLGQCGTPLTPWSNGKSDLVMGGAPIVFPPAGGQWGTVTHTIGPFVPLPIRAHVRKRDRGMERLIRRLARLPRLLTITEE